jgi:hypothetical protein
VSALITAASARWPDDRDHPARLLMRLLEEGARSLEEEREDAVRKRREAIAATRGALTGCYEPGYLERLREDWPE